MDSMIRNPHKPFSGRTLAQAMKARQRGRCRSPVPAVALVACLFGLANSTGTASPRTDRLQTDVQETIDRFKKVDPNLEEFFSKSAGYAVFPRVSKGAAGIGAASGEGLVYVDGKIIGEAKLSQVTLGVQLGGQVYSEVVFFEDPEALERFKADNLKFAAQAGAVAASDGASKDAKYEWGVAIFTLARSGLMFEASVGGQKFKFKEWNAE